MRNVWPRHTTPIHGSPAGMRSFSDASVGLRRLSMRVVANGSSMWAASRIEHLRVAKAARVLRASGATEIVGGDRRARESTDAHGLRLVIERRIERMLAGGEHHQRIH